MTKLRLVDPTQSSAGQAQHKAESQARGGVTTFSSVLVMAGAAVVGVAIGLVAHCRSRYQPIERTEESEAANIGL